MLTNIGLGAHRKDILGKRRQSDVVEHNRYVKMVRQGQVTNDGMKRGIANSEQSLRLLVREGATTEAEEEYKYSRKYAILYI